MGSYHSKFGELRNRFLIINKKCIHRNISDLKSIRIKGLESVETFVCSIGSSVSPDTSRPRELSYYAGHDKAMI